MSLTIEEQQQLHRQWAEWLSTEYWQWFVTFTFKDEIHPEAASKLFRLWIHKLNVGIYGRRWMNREPYGVKWVRALEWQKRGVLHYHALIANVGMEERSKWANVWAELGKSSKAGFIKIDQYDESKGGAESYLSKYVTKGGQIDISANFKQIPYIPKVPTNGINPQQQFNRLD